MGTLYNVLHANEIAHERDAFKRCTVGLTLSSIGLVVATKITQGRLTKLIDDLEARCDKLEIELQTLHGGVSNDMINSEPNVVWKNPTGPIPSVSTGTDNVETLTDIVPDPSPNPLDEFFEVDLDKVKEVKPDEKEPETKETTKTTKGGKK